MPLYESREQLKAALHTGVAKYNDVKGLIDAWFHEVKEAEKRDTFPLAYKDNRMSVRDMNLGGANQGGNFPINNIDSANTPAQHLTPEERKALLAKGDENLTPEDRELLKDPRRVINLARDKAGIEARTNPENFWDPVEMKSRKNELGLHDLSATLLDGSQTIKGQMKPYPNAITVFMPLPQEEDLQMFAVVNDLGKKAGGESAVREMRSKFTRVKLAQAIDMHTYYVDITDGDNAHSGKFRYGYMGWDKNGAVADAGLAKLLADRKEAAKHYKSILPEEVELAPAEHLSPALLAVQKELHVAGPPPPPPPKKPKHVVAVNEIVVAYRAHGTGKFPLFTKWEPVKKRFYFYGPDGKLTADWINDKGELGSGK